MRTKEQTARLVAELLHRNNKDVVRIRPRTIRKLSGRNEFPDKYIEGLSELLLVNFGWVMLDLGDKKLVVIRKSFLEIAEKVQATILFDEHERKAILDDNIEKVKFNVHKIDEFDEDGEDREDY